MSELDDFEIDIKTVHIETKNISLEAIELYEMPVSSVEEMMSVGGPEQLGRMIKLFRLAVVNPADSENLSDYSFNEVTDAVFQWYNKSKIRVSGLLEDSISSKIDPPLN